MAYLYRYTGSSPDDLHSELVSVESGDPVEEPDDDYTPLDPAYLPPGLEDEASDKDVSKDASINLDEVSHLRHFA